MAHGAAVSWVCGTDTFTVWNTQAKVFADCFADAGLIGLSALIFLIGQAWPCRTSSDPKEQQYGNSSQAGKHILERWRIPRLLAASLVVTWVVFFLLEGTLKCFTSIAHHRPHVFIAGALQSVAWLAALVSLQRSRRPQHWLVLATSHLQPIALALVILPKAIAGAVRSEDIPLAVALGLEVVFVVAVDWQHAVLHALSDEDALRQPLLQGEEAAERSPSSLSQLAFSWVTPLISLGSRRQLQHEDMLPLPPALGPQHCRRLMWQQWHQAKEHAEEQAKQKGEQMRNLKISLWRALWTGFGWPYISLGLLKLFSDALNFAGPLLLNALLKFLGQGRSHGHHNERPLEQPQSQDMHSALRSFLNRDSAAYGCCLVALLGLTAVLKGVLNTQYSFRRGALACQLRAALSALVFDKTLMVSTADMAGFSAGTVQTMMSVDADRVVNMFSWMHELWSLPLQIVVALGLLYTQVRLAFLGGLAVVLLLVPINKWLAKRIEAATNTKMTFKDLRVKRTGELLRGIHQIKAAAWEPAFVAHIREAREGELQALTVEKYLDALCVYFWAATSILTSIITFTLYALLGYHLTADVVFTSLALFNVLIVPLNGFPWVGPIPRRIKLNELYSLTVASTLQVINGLIEALVSVRRLQRFLSCNDDDSQWQPHPFGSSKAAAREDPAWKDTSTDAESLRKSKPWWRLGLGHAKRGSADETVSLLPKQALPLSFDVPAFRRQHVTASGMPTGQSACAVLLQDASFAWATQADAAEEDSHADEAKRPVSAPVRGWALAQNRDVLRELSLAIPQGSLTAIVGDIGSGKSSLLAAILGELRGNSGRVKIQGSLAYVPQQPWVMSGTLRDNILFKKQLEEERYRKVLEACALDVDVKALPAGDGTWIGDKGATLSGGQRARLALARAIYQDCDIYLLDDVLAAVDASVAALLWERAICGLLRSKTRLVVTHSQRFASLSQTVLRLDRGQIAYIGAASEDPFRLWGPEPGAAQDDVKGKGKALARSWSSPGSNLLEEQHVPSVAAPAVEPHRAAAALPVDGVSNVESAEKVEAALEAQAQQEEEEEARQEGHVQAQVYMAYGRAAGWTIMVVLAVSFIIMQATQNGSDLWLSYWVSHEHKQRLRLGDAIDLGSPALPMGQCGLDLGRINALQGSSWTWAGACIPLRQGADVPLYNSSIVLGPMTALSKNYFSYLPSANPSWSELQNSFWKLGHSLGNVQQIWSSFQSKLQPGVRFYLTVLLTIAAANSLFILLRAFSFAKGGLVAAQEMHAALLGAVVRAPLSFFNRTPPGRVLNRFSSDMDTIDDDLPFIMNIFLSEAFEMLGTLVVLVISQPLLAAVFVPLAFIYRWIQAFYRQSSRELRRLSSVARSPVYSGFSEAIDGAPTIRGFSAQAAFSQQNVAGLEVLQRANYAGIAAAQWLSLRLQLLAAAVITIVAALGVVSTAGMLPAFASYHHRRAGAGLIGLSLSYALSITEILNGVLTTSAETEQEMVSVERIQEYIQLPPQAPMLPQPRLLSASISGEGFEEAGPPSATIGSPAAHWPMPGRVEFMGVVLRYAGQSAPALNGLDLDVPGGSKIGICGRTGAGKSSVVGALLRLTEIEAGQILIDSMDIRNVRLARLRSAVSVVPQSAFLFEGSVRDNLDPMGRHSDRELIAVLKSTRLWDILCGVSLSQSKGLARVIAAQSPGPQQGSVPQPPRSASRPIQPKSPTAGSIRAGTSPQTPSGSRQVPPLPKPGQRPGQRQSFSAPSTSYMPPPDSPASSLAGSYLGEGSNAGEASTSEAGHGEALRQKRHGPSRYFSERAGTFAEALAGESTGVLFHTGFGGQLLNLRLGENGVGLSQGQQQLLCLARVLLRRPRIVCLDECTASVDPRTAELMQDLIAKELSSATIIQIAHRLESVMGCDQVAVMDKGRVVECGPPARLLGDAKSHFSALHSKA